LVEASSTSGSPGSGALRALADLHGISPARSLGQHFLTDPNLAKAIAHDAGVGPGDRVVEIGAGLGSLTVALADTGAARVLAIEFDRALLPALRAVVADRPSVEVLAADATKMAWPAVLDGGAWVCCGNLPYNVGTAIVLDVLERAPMVQRLVVTVQREVADRFGAAPGARDYGPTSIRIAYRATVEVVRAVPREVFWPRPSVASSVVRITRLDHPAVDVGEDRLWRVVDEAFAQRRKTIRAAVRRLGVEDPGALLELAHVPAGARPEELTLGEFARIAEALPA
jgi:16S rRNA (adenine1518-N6/adenine1519-N6)-dimethyltransferase